MTLMDLPIARKSGSAPPGTRPPTANANGAPDPEVRFTVDQFHAMIENGIIEEGAPIELLGGRLVWKDRSAVGEDPMSVGTAHTWVINALIKLDAKLTSLGCHMRVQSPITLPS